MLSGAYNFCSIKSIEIKQATYIAVISDTQSYYHISVQFGPVIDFLSPAASDGSHPYKWPSPDLL